MRRFSTVNLEKLLSRLKMPDDEAIESAVVTRAIHSAQNQVEQLNFEVRRNVLKYDEVMNEQRKVIYAARWRVLKGEDLSREVRDMLVDVIAGYVDGATAGKPAKAWDLDALWAALNTLYPVGLEKHSLPGADFGSGRGKLTRQKLLRALIADAEGALAQWEAEIANLSGEGAARQIEREVILGAIDQKWREHLYEMDYLKLGIGLRALAQQDPIVEYQREGYDMFMRMLEALKEQCIASLFGAELEAQIGPG